MGHCVGCIKYILFVFNFCLWLLGCALLSVGIWMKLDESANHYVRRMTDKVDEVYQINYSATGDSDMTVTLSYLLIVFGVILIIITFIGCCGAVRENQCLLGTFAVCLFALMAALIGVGSWAFVKKDNVSAHTDELRNRTTSNLDRAVSLYFKDEPSRYFMDSVHARFRCCGSNNARRDFLQYGRVPNSCEREHQNRGCAFYYFYYVGEEIQEFLKKRYTVITGVALGVAFCLCLGMVLAFLLCCFIRRATRLVVS